MDCGLISLIAIGCAFVAIVSLGHSLLVSFRDQLEARYSHRSAMARWVVLALSMILISPAVLLIGIIILVYSILTLFGAG